MCQISAPLSGQQRILYLFGCLQPPCWNRQDSWTCLRSQTTDQAPLTSDEKPNSDLKGNKVTDWLGEADDWGDEEVEEQEDPNGNFGVVDGSQSQSDSNIVAPLK